MTISVVNILLIAALCAMTSFLSHMGMACFHDGIRPVVPEYIEGRMSRAEFASIEFGLSVGFIASVGIGNALTEHYIEENGRPWTQHLGQYKMPGIKHMPAMRNFVVEDPTAEGPYGAKGVGEISSIPISPAITNAIYNAVGVRCMALPVDQDALLLAMKHGEREIDRRWGDAPVK